MSIAALLFDDDARLSSPGFYHGRNQSVSIQNQLALGQLILAFLSREYPDAAEEGAGPMELKTFRFPYGFFKRFIRQELRLVYANAKYLQCRKAVEVLRDAVARGAKPPDAMRDFRKAGSLRGDGGRRNASKSVALSHVLFQYFVDEFQKLLSRSDPSLLLKEARRLRLILEESEESENMKMLKLEGPAGKVWVARWRKEWGIVHKACGMQLKVSWRKILRRVACSFGNYWRLRFFWESLFPGKPLRWMSLDQKPSWFNNAGHTGTHAVRGRIASVKEKFAQTRSRYTILTEVSSWTAPHTEALS